MHPTTHKRLLIAFVCVTSLLGVGAFADLLPDKYFGAAFFATLILTFLKTLIVRVGDAMDDGELNGSFNPERTGSVKLEASSGTKIVSVPAKDITLRLALGFMGLLCLGACSFFQRVVVPLSELGLEAAAQRGKIKPGDRVLIGEGLAYLASADASTTTRDKVMRLSELGLAAAVEHGQLKPGDVVLIKAAGAVIQKALAPQEKEAALPGAETSYVSEGWLWEREGGLLNPWANR